MPQPKRLSLSELRRRSAREPGASSAAALVEQILERQALPEASHIYTRVDAEAARLMAAHADASTDSFDSPSGRLRGVPITIKDLFNVRGEVTRAGSTLRAQDAPASADAVAVARLRAAGAVFVGRTNMTEFAFSGVGLNPHFGTPRNPHDAAVHRIPGGSSSGAAVSVALGLAVAGLGSDTGGSLRVPAALCGLVGFKPTQTRVPRDGAFELSRTLDSVGAITNSVSDAIAIDAVIADESLGVSAPTDLRGARLAVPQTVMLDALEPAVAAAFERACRLLRDAGATLVDVPLSEFAEVAAVNSPGGFSAVEAFAVHRADLDARRSGFDHRVAARIEPGRGVSAADYIAMHDKRRDWIARVTAQLHGFDAFVSPSVPMVAPALKPLQDDDATFFKVNGLLLRNTFIVNLLDGCGFSLPMQSRGELPMGLMLSSTRGRDAPLARLALAVEALLSPRAGEAD